MSGQKGSALIMALIISVVLMALGLAISMASLGDFTMSEEFEGHERALFIAESGLAGAHRTLRGRDLTEALSATTQVNLYASQGPTFHRDPIAFLEARSIDYRRLPNALGSISLRGMLTPGTGTPVGNGRFVSRISDNDDGDGDLATDLDGEFYVRVAGIHPGPPQEMLSHGSIVKNSVVMIEAYYERDMTLDVSSPFTVYGPDVTPNVDNEFFSGNSFLLDGYDHSHLTIDQIRAGHSHAAGDLAMAGLSTLNNDPLAGDGGATLNEIYDGLGKNQGDNIQGADGPYGSSPSIRDDTEMVRNSGNEDATNLFYAYWLATFIEKVSAAADQTLADGTDLSGPNIQFGTEENPQIVVAEGDLTLSGSGQGCGLLIVKGSLSYTGAVDYNGLILVVGEGVVDFGGVNKGIIGGLYLANITDDGSGNPIFGPPSFSVRGQTNFYFRGKSIRMALSLLPFKQIAWREITPEIAQ